LISDNLYITATPDSVKECFGSYDPTKPDPGFARILCQNIDELFNQGWNGYKTDR
jgi:hypothetical protein